MLKILNRERLLVSLNDVSNILPTSTNIHIRQYNINLMRLIHHYNLVIKNNEKKSNNSNIAIYDHERKLLLSIRSDSDNKKMKFLPLTRNSKMSPQNVTEFVKVLFALHPQYYVKSLYDNNLGFECYSELRRFICNNVIIDDNNLIKTKQFCITSIDEVKLIIMFRNECILSQSMMQNIVYNISDERYLNCLIKKI